KQVRLGGSGVGALAGGLPVAAAAADHRAWSAYASDGSRQAGPAVRSPTAQRSAPIRLLTGMVHSSPVSPRPSWFTVTLIETGESSCQCSHAVGRGYSPLRRH